MPCNPLPLPLAGITVIEMTQTIMGPSAGLVLADLGADVVKIEPAPAGDPTRLLSGFTAGFFGFFNRNKRSVAIDLKRPEGLALLRRLVERADALIENYAPGTMDRLGCGWAALHEWNPRLVYCALKGFLSGPYEDRPALDEIVQFMGGLAYMTGPAGQPLRAGTSVVDIMGGVFAVVAILAALRERDRTGKGQMVKSALFESTVFMMGQHMAGEAITGEEVPPMPVRRAGWGIYQPFATADGDQVFVAVTSDRHWRRFCEAFACSDLLADERLASNEQRVAARPWLLPIVAEMLAGFDKAEIMARCAAASIPFAPVARPADLFTDPHLAASSGLLEVTLPGGVRTRLPRLPIEFAGEKPGLRCEAPEVGEHTREVLLAAGVAEAELRALEDIGAIKMGRRLPPQGIVSAQS
jgi:crotonobetainyl-CoA:carnitine CoA-transferase CaiB-like acyl-CoA transferase